MKLSEENEKIKADLMKFVNGEYDSNFTKEQLEFATKLSFWHVYRLSLLFY